MVKKHQVPNKLLNEKSPYLLQHAHNPVDWYPWGPEAFARAVSEDKPIFLSIGYSTCHWCHVMERESFEDEEVARLLNKHYIAIKVDREERPDIDNIYMSVCQALTGHGGWPLTIIMTPDKKPFYAGTYFPKRTKMGHPGLIEILDYLKDAWINEKEKLLQSSESILTHLTSDYRNVREVKLSEDTLARAFMSFLGSFDQSYGGFGIAPKFPSPHNLCFLLRYWKTTGNSHALNMVERTLEGMYRGGIYDHIGFGFSRYSTDKKWLVPHFEKMLYDNALLAIAYLEVYQATGKEEYSKIVKQILEYVMRDMTSPDGGFYSAEDADSEGEEGKFYVWSPDEIASILGKEQGDEFCKYFDITVKGNFEGKSIPNVINNKAAYEDILPKAIDEMRQRVFKARDKRIHPYKDDKILTAWNGLMIAAFSMAARILKDKSYLQAAEKAVNFIMLKLRRYDGRLLARYRDGDAAFPAYLDDYAFMIWGLIELYEAGFDTKYLKQALELNKDMIKYFLDKENGGFFLYGHDSEQLITRPKDVYDGAMPSGNSVAAMNMLRLARITGSFELEEYAEKQFKLFGENVESYPMGHSHFLMAVQFALAKTSEIVLVGKRREKETEAMLDIMHKSFLPYSVVIVKDVDLNHKEIEELVPFIERQHMIDNKATAYICENYACKAPVTDPISLERAIAKNN